jgi:uncharacterized protein
MILGMKFSTLRLIILTVAILSQIYLFIRIRHALISSRRSDRFKTNTIRTLMITICIFLILNGYILSMPRPWIFPPVSAQVLLFYSPAVWGFASIFAAILLLLGSLVHWVVRSISKLVLFLRGHVAEVPVDPGRRLFLKSGAFGIAAAPFILSGYGATYTARNCEVRELTLPFGFPLRAAQLTDIHAGIFMTRKQMRHYTDQIIKLEPDIFFLTGDYVSNSIAFLPDCLEEMARVKTRYGAFATLGNHEHWYGRPREIRKVFQRFPITLLNNAHHTFNTSRGGFAVAGIDDLRFGSPDLRAAVRGLDAAVPTILLSHRPEIFPKSAKLGIPLTLSGHYHGGQIKLRLPGADISLAHFVTDYPEGLYRKNNSHLYVSRGVGTTFTPIRLNAPPEINLFNLI